MSPNYYASPSYQTPTYAAEQAGMVTAQTAGQLVNTVVSPTLGFARGFLGGTGAAIWIGVGIIALVLWNENKAK